MTNAADTKGRVRPLILLVDDFTDTLEMYAEYLELSGFDSVAATSGEEAIEKALALEPAVIFMDLAMPRMDGLEATRRLKADPRTRHIPVIAVSGHTLADDAIRARATVFDATMSKPCLPEEILVAVRRLLHLAR